jgi:hypothetical protein
MKSIREAASSPAPNFDEFTRRVKSSTKKECIYAKKNLVDLTMLVPSSCKGRARFVPGPSGHDRGRSVVGPWQGTGWK